jgi:hypothetical protein
MPFSERHATAMKCVLENLEHGTALQKESVTTLVSFDITDWNAFFALLEGEGMLWRLGPWLKEQASKEIWSAGAFEAWQKGQRKLDHAQAFMLSRAEALFERVEKKHLPVLVLKGAFLAQSMYASEKNRPFGDIDLLCRKGDVEAVAEEAQCLGFARPPENYWRWLMVNYYNVPLFFPQGRPFYLDLHWNIASRRYRIQAERLWDKSVAWKSECVRSLCAEHCLIHLALHALENGLCLPLAAWCDFSAILEKKTLSMAALWHEARVLRCENILFTALEASEKFWGSAAVAACLETAPLSPVARERMKRLAEKAAAKTDGSPSFSRKINLFILTADEPAALPGILSQEVWSRIKNGSEPWRVLEEWKQSRIQASASLFLHG